MRVFLRRLNWLIRRPARDAELQAELRFHLEEEAAERAAQGLDSEAARLAARRELGNVTRLQEETRSLWTWTLWDQFVHDVRYAFRTMAANKMFSVLAILSLALGIGANTAIFSFMDSILLRALPVQDPESLVLLSWHTPQPNTHGSNRHDESYLDPNGAFVGGVFSYPAFELLRKNDAVFSTVFGYQGMGDVNLIVGGHAALAPAEYVTGEYFRGLGVPPAGGRLIEPDDDRSGAAAVAVISFTLSQSRFGGPEKAVGQAVLINNVPFTVIGVTPPQFFGADPDLVPAIYLPLHAHPLLHPGDQFYSPKIAFTDPNYDWIVMMARLRPGVQAAQAQAVAGPQFSQWIRTANTVNQRWNLPTLLVRNGGGGLDGLKRRYSKPLLVLLSLVGLILMIACANIANLLLARAAARRREIAVRLSMGAGRGRVIRQLLTESVLLAATGGALGIGFAVWGMRFLTLLLANGREDFTLRAELNWHVLAVVAALSLLTGILFGLAPALQATRVDLMPALKESLHGRSRGTGRLPLARVLVIAQIAFTLLILVAAGLFLRTLSNLQSIQLGFNRESLLTFKLAADQSGRKEAEIVALYNDLRNQFAAIPGVRSATFSKHSLVGEGTSGMMSSVSGGEPKSSRILTIGQDFFTTMEIPILLGRTIDERDRAGAPLTAVVNESFARRSFGDRSPLGAHFTLPRACAKCQIEIVGVSANALYGDLKGKVAPTIYLPFGQGIWPLNQMVFELRTTGNPVDYVPVVREIVRRTDSRLPVFDVATQSARIDKAINQEITFARLCTAFALLALMIACVGLYGTMSYNVAQRTGEIGIRMALGAPRGGVIWMVLREVLTLAAAGLAVGVPAALVASKLVESFLFEMTARDPEAMIVAALALVIAAMLAGYLPARGASRIDPLAALRHE